MKERIGIGALERREGVHRTTIARWQRTRGFPAHHYLGRDRQWWLDEVMAWEALQAARPAGERPCNLPRKPTTEPPSAA